MALVLDTGIVVAIIDGDDRHHERCAKLVAETEEPLVVPVAALPEIDCHLRKRGLLEGWTAFVEDVGVGAFSLAGFDEWNLSRAAELESTYADLGLGFVDASVIATCEALGETKVATLDRRHFSVVRPRHCDTLTLLPE